MEFFLKVVNMYVEIFVFTRHCFALHFNIALFKNMQVSVWNYLQSLCQVISLLSNEKIFMLKDALDFWKQSRKIWNILWWLKYIIISYSFGKKTR